MDVLRQLGGMGRYVAVAGIGTVTYLSFGIVYFSKATETPKWDVFTIATLTILHALGGWAAYRICHAIYRILSFRQRFALSASLYLRAFPRAEDPSIRALRAQLDWYFDGHIPSGSRERSTRFFRLISNKKRWEWTKAWNIALDVVQLGNKEGKQFDDMLKESRNILLALYVARFAVLAGAILALSLLVFNASGTEHPSLPLPRAFSALRDPAAFPVDWYGAITATVIVFVTFGLAGLANRSLTDRNARVDLASIIRFEKEFRAALAHALRSYPFNSGDKAAET